MTNVEPRKDAQLSGGTYVSAVLKADHEGKPARIQVRKVENCDHSAFVCTRCLWSWEIDWAFLFENTAGGRRLKVEAGR